ncbi:MAG TPA: nucleoside triphosphate pyrophosphohydrolase [Gemmatimonadaceae bacterium]|nr:nucleoside triphosphate pyrophosphohydrolase [Gemmatimonadaceae bacterium]
MQDTSPMDNALALMRDLRTRCDWDRAQTHGSLRPYLMEETHELDDALRSGDARLMREELGDVFLQVLFHAVIAEEEGAFDMADVANGMIAKMKARHPHLYGGGAREPWERMKARQRASIADGLPLSLPPLHRAHRLQDRAAGVGFDWPDTDGPAAKVEEELGEVREQLDHAPQVAARPQAGEDEAAHAALEAELGDLLFAAVNLCRKAGVHAALALDRANAKFAHRFEGMEQIAAERGIAMRDAGLSQLDALWDEVKAGE